MSPILAIILYVMTGTLNFIFELFPNSLTSPHMTVTQKNDLIIEFLLS